MTEENRSVKYVVLDKSRNGPTAVPFHEIYKTN